MGKRKIFLYQKSSIDIPRILVTRYLGKLHFKYDILKSNEWAKKGFLDLVRMEIILA